MGNKSTWGILAALVGISVAIGVYLDWNKDPCKQLDEYCARAHASHNIVVSMQCALVIQGEHRSSPRACAASLRALKKVNGQ